MDEINENGVVRKMTPEEKARYESCAAEREREYWSVSYEEAVDREIRKRYSASAEFAILRQRDEKSEEYKAYYDYCEQCKALVRQKRAEYELN